eukprot:1538531-Pleurochrysis_carterae.AAC.2
MYAHALPTALPYERHAMVVLASSAGFRLLGKIEPPLAVRDHVQKKIARRGRTRPTWAIRLKISTDAGGSFGATTSGVVSIQGEWNTKDVLRRDGRQEPSITSKNHRESDRSAGAAARFGAGSMVYCRTEVERTQAAKGSQTNSRVVFQTGSRAEWCSSLTLSGGGKGQVSAVNHRMVRS